MNARHHTEVSPVTKIIGFDFDELVPTIHGNEEFPDIWEKLGKDSNDFCNERGFMNSTSRRTRDGRG